MTREQMLALGFTDDDEFGYYTHKDLPGEFIVRKNKLDWGINLEYHIKSIPCTEARIKLLIQALS